MEIPMHQLRVLRTCRSDARSQSPESARRPRPARGRPARSRRGRARNRGVAERAFRAVELPVFSLCWIRTAVPRRTTAALVAASGEEGRHLLLKRFLIAVRRVGQVVRYQEADGPSWQRPQQLGVALEEHAEVGSAAAVSQAHRNTCVLPSSPMPIGSLSVNRRTVCPASDENVSDGRSANGTRRDGRKVGDLFSLGRKPLKIALPEDSVEHHQPFDGATQRKRPAMAIVGLTNRLVHRLVMKVVEPGRVVPQRRAVAYLRATSFRKKSCTFCPWVILAKAE